MKKYFIELCWNGENNPYFHMKDCETGIDEYVNIPNELYIKKLNQKICVGTINPYTREYISCNNIIENGEHQCNKCRYMFDFYKCIRCHGRECNVKNKDVLNYCNTFHYVYLACFPNRKIKVGTASEIRKYNRLLEQGAIFSIFIAKAPTGKIARQIEQNIIDSGVSGAVTNSYKMENMIFNDSEIAIKKELIKKYKEILNSFSEDSKHYLIEPEFNSFKDLKLKIENKMLSENIQLDLFEEKNKTIRPYIKRRECDTILGTYLFCIGKILAIENNGIIELIDTKKMEGYLFDFENNKNLVRV